MQISLCSLLKCIFYFRNSLTRHERACNLGGPAPGRSEPPASRLAAESYEDGFEAVSPNGEAVALSTPVTSGTEPACSLHQRTENISQRAENLCKQAGQHGENLPLSLGTSEAVKHLGLGKTMSLGTMPDLILLKLYRYRLLIFHLFLSYTNYALMALQCIRKISD